MTGRGLRVRQKVDYNNKESMVPAWLKSISTTTSKTPPKNPPKRKIKAGGSAEKENAVAAMKVGLESKPVPKAIPSEEKEKPIAEKEKKSKPKKSIAKAEKETAPARGRNAGLTVVPIQDKKGKASLGAGPRKSEAPRPAPLPKPPEAPKEIPGLPGIVQKPAASKPASVKRKPPVVEVTPPASKLPTASRPAVPIVNDDADDDYPHQQIQKRSKTSAVTITQPASQPAPPPQFYQSQPATSNFNALRRSTAHRSSIAFPAPLSPQNFSFSPIPEISGVEKQLEESRRNFAELQALYHELQEENTALKTASIRDQVEELFAQHTERVLEHGEKASELATHWREEAERMATLLAESRVEETAAQARAIRAELATARQALLDMEVAKAEQDKAIVELQKRNALLERYARKKPAMMNKCVGTDDGAQAMQARAMAPEGAAGSSMYRGVNYPGAAGNSGAHVPLAYRNNNPHMGMDAPFPLHGQRTGIYNDAGSSDMQLASIESVQAIQQQASIRGRRVSAPLPQPLHARPGQTAADVSRQIHFYSNTLSVVPEEAEEEGGNNYGRPAAALLNSNYNKEHQNNNNNSNSNARRNDPVAPPPPPPPAGGAPTGTAVPNSSGPTSALLSRGQGLQMAAHMETRPLSNGRFQFTHHPTGFRFILGSCEPDPEDPDINMSYEPLTLGNATEALDKASGGVLLEEFQFSEEQAEHLFAMICKAMAISADERRQQHQQVHQ